MEDGVPRMSWLGEGGQEARGTAVLGPPRKARQDDGKNRLMDRGKAVAGRGWGSTTDHSQQ